AVAAVGRRRGGGGPARARAPAGISWERDRVTRLAPRKVLPVGPPADAPVRTMSVWVPDWPLVAAGVEPAEPAAVFVANRVVACTASARAAGVRRHMRRREAQSRAPSLVVLDHDPDRDARAFEAVVQ